MKNSDGHFIAMKKNSKLQLIITRNFLHNDDNSINKTQYDVYKEPNTMLNSYSHTKKNA